MYEYVPTSDWVNRVSKWPFPFGTLFFLLSSGIARDVFKRLMVEHSTDTALHPIYAYKRTDTGYSVWDHRWQSSKAAQSLRFRFEWIKATLTKLIQSDAAQFPKFSIVSLGSGTGLAYLDVLLQFPEFKDRIKLTLVDLDTRALRRATEMYQQHGIQNEVQTVSSCSTDFLIKSKEKFDLVESIGIAEYVDDDWLQNEFNKIYEVVAEKGAFIGAAISLDEEYRFAHKVLHWPKMIYRSPEKLEEMLKNAGFENIKLEKCGVFVGWIAKR